MHKVIIRSHRPGLWGKLLLSNLWFSYHNEHHAKTYLPSFELEGLNKKNYFQNDRPSSTYLASFLRLMVNLSNPTKLKNSTFINKPEIKSKFVSCGLCNSKEYDYYSQSRDYEYETSSNLWTFVRCKKCKNIYLNSNSL